MRVAIMLGGWLAISLVLGPWVGRFVSTHSKVRDRPPATAKTIASENASAAEPMRLARRA